MDDTKRNLKYIVVDFDDSIDFIKFVAKKKIHCVIDSHDHKCSSLYNYRMYYKYIFQNGYLKHIKIFMTVFMELLRLLNHINLYNIIHHEELFENGIDNETFFYLFKIGFLGDIIDIINHVVSNTKTITVDFMDKILVVYKNKLIQYAIDDICINSACYDKIYKILIDKSLETDNLNLFNFIVEELDTVFMDVDESKLTFRQKNRLDSIKNKHSYNSTRINSIIKICLSKHSPVKNCPKIFSQLITDLGGVMEMIDHDFYKIFYRGIINYAEIVCENLIHTSPELIDDLLLKARRMEMFQLLVDHGANYKKIYKTTTDEKQKKSLKRFINNLKDKEYLEDIDDIDDSDESDDSDDSEDSDSFGDSDSSGNSEDSEDSDNSE
ncbi:hypothetical protein [Acanthamoeba polyphaga mimivirus]|nr:hypothetical protein [Samba virus]AKI80831.1 hypothetical protein [Acanthamoeba polyphaga mimivirus]